MVMNASYLVSRIDQCEGEERAQFLDRYCDVKQDTVIEQEYMSRPWLHAVFDAKETPEREIEKWDNTEDGVKVKLPAANETDGQSR